MTTPLFLPEAVASRVRRLGPDAVSWLDAVPQLAASVAGRWGVEIGYPPDQPTDAVILRGRRGSQPVVLKLWFDKGRCRAEQAVLAAAQGVGYVRLIEADPDLGVLLLEGLGGALDADDVERTEGTDRLTGILGDTLTAAWRVSPSVWPLPESPHPAERLREAIVANPAPFDVPDCRAAVDRALAYAEQRRDADDPDRRVLAHGNPHLGNFRSVNPTRAGAETGYVLIDPHPTLVEPEYDLGIVVRDGNRHLLHVEDAVVWTRNWCARLAERTGTDAEAVWQWGYLHRVALGLRLVNGPTPLSGRLYLQTATALISRWRA